MMSHLVGLGHISEDTVHHRNQHPVLVRVSRVLDDGDNIGPLLRHVQQVAAGPM